jgi:hypothetical protein
VRHHQTGPSDEQRNRTWLFAALLAITILCVLRLRAGGEGLTFERVLALGALPLSLALALAVGFSLVHRGR